MEYLATQTGRLERLARAVAELAGARNVCDVREVLLSHAAEAVDAVVVSLSLLSEDGTTLVLEGISGAPGQVRRDWASYPVAANVPASEAVRTRAPVHCATTAEFERRFPVFAGLRTVERVLTCLPLLCGDRCLGAISLSFEGEQPDPREQAFIGALADACAQALDRIRADRAAAEAGRRLEFLARASVELASSLDYRTTVSNVAQLVVPALADWCIVNVLADGRLHTLAVAHADPRQAALAEEFERRWPPVPGTPRGRGLVARTGVSELYAHISPEAPIPGSSERHRTMVRELGLRSALVVPLTARNRVLGTLTWLASESGPRYGPEDLAFAEELARRAAVAIDNAQLHTETLQAAVRLQQALLPAALPTLVGYEAAAEYRASGCTDVGGDFYDVIALPDGRVAAAVGDVMGRGIAAAAAMAQVRAALRAYVAIDPDPRAVLRHLDVMHASGGLLADPASPQFVTLVYLVADGPDVMAVNAGHPPLLAVCADGSRALLPAVPSPPLGVPAATRPVQRIRLAPGATLLAYTDGLVERRGEDIDAGLERLRAAAPLAAPPYAGGLAGALARLVDAVRDPDRDDDICALALRRSVGIAG